MIILQQAQYLNAELQEEQIVAAHQISIILTKISRSKEATSKLKTIMHFLLMKL